MTLVAIGGGHLLGLAAALAIAPERLEPME
jgi:hypothetical protein